jgi:hypothetical protein
MASRIELHVQRIRFMFLLAAGREKRERGFSEFSESK